MSEFSQREKQLAICHFLMKICSKERFIEIKRQILSEKKDFEPYVAYRRILRKLNSDGITSKAMRIFLDENLVSACDADCEKLIRHYSRKGSKLNFKDFLNMIQPKENPDQRTLVSLKDVYEIKDDEYLEYETEISLALLLEKELDFFNEISDEKDNLDSLGITEEEIINLIDSERNQEINFDNMFNLFRKNNLVPYDEEIISFLRRIDKDDDGVITLNELKEFFDLIPKNESQTQRDAITSVDGNRRFNLCRISVEQYKRISPARKIAFSPDQSNTIRASLTSRHNHLKNCSKSSRETLLMHSKKKNKPTTTFSKSPSEKKEETHIATTDRFSRPESLEKIKVSMSDKNFFINPKYNNVSEFSHEKKQTSKGSIINVMDETRTNFTINQPKTKRSVDFEDTHSFNSGHKKSKRSVDFEENPSFNSGYKRYNQKGSDYNDVTMANTIITSDDKLNTSTEKMKIVIKTLPKQDQEFYYETNLSEELSLNPSKKLNFRSNSKIRTPYNNIGSDSFSPSKKSMKSSKVNLRQNSMSEEDRILSLKKYALHSGEDDQKKSIDQIKKELDRDFPGGRGNVRNKSYFDKRQNEMKNIEKELVDKYKKRSNSRKSGSKSSNINRHKNRTKYFDETKDWGNSLRAKFLSKKGKVSDFSVINSDMKVSPMRVKNSNSVYLQNQNNDKRYLDNRNSVRNTIRSITKGSSSNFDYSPMNDIQNKKSRRKLNSLTHQEKENCITRLRKLEGNDRTASSRNVITANPKYPSKNQTSKYSPINNKLLQDSKVTSQSKNFSATQSFKKNKSNLRRSIDNKRKSIPTITEFEDKAESPREDRPERHGRIEEPESNPKDTQIELFDCVINVLLNEEKSLELCRQELILQENFYPLNLFNSIDTLKQAWFNVEQFETFLELIGVTILERNKIIELYGYYDRSQKCLLNYDEFCKMLEPRSDKHNKIFNKQKKHVCKDKSAVHDPLANTQIIRVLRDLFRNLFSLKSSIVESKKLLSVHDVNLLYVFNKICDKKCGEITKARFISMMKEKDTYIRNAKTQDIVLQFEKLDLDQDDVISYKDFVQAFSMDR